MFYTNTNMNKIIVSMLYVYKNQSANMLMWRGGGGGGEVGVYERVSIGSIWMTS